MANSFKEELINLSWELRIITGSPALRSLFSLPEIQNLHQALHWVQIESNHLPQDKQSQARVERLCADAKFLVDEFEKRKDQYVFEQEKQRARSERKLQLYDALIDLADTNDAEPRKAAIFREFEERFKTPKAGAINSVINLALERLEGLAEKKAKKKFISTVKTTPAEQEKKLEYKKKVITSLSETGAESNIQAILQAARETQGEIKAVFLSKTDQEEEAKLLKAIKHYAQLPEKVFNRFNELHNDHEYIPTWFTKAGKRIPEISESATPARTHQLLQLKKDMAEPTQEEIEAKRKSPLTKKSILKKTAPSNGTSEGANALPADAIAAVDPSSKKRSGPRVSVADEYEFKKFYRIEKERRYIPLNEGVPNPQEAQSPQTNKKTPGVDMLPKESQKDPDFDSFLEKYQSVREAVSKGMDPDEAFSAQFGNTTLRSEDFKRREVDRYDISARLLVDEKDLHKSRLRTSRPRRFIRKIMRGYREPIEIEQATGPVSMVQVQEEKKEAKVINGQTIKPSGRDIEFIEPTPSPRYIPPDIDEQIPKNGLGRSLCYTAPDNLILKVKIGDIIGFDSGENGTGLYFHDRGQGTALVVPIENLARSSPPVGRIREIVDCIKNNLPVKEKSILILGKEPPKPKKTHTR